MVSPTSVTVIKSGQQAFRFDAGRLGYANSAQCDYLCFASGIIGASYTVLEDAARRIAGMGYETLFVNDGREVLFAATSA